SGQRREPACHVPHHEFGGSQRGGETYRSRATADCQRQKGPPLPAPGLLARRCPAPPLASVKGNVTRVYPPSSGSSLCSIYYTRPNVQEFKDPTRYCWATRPP